MHSDVVIIGSGISGLTAAAILAKNGKQVLVVEKKPRIGGALKRFKRRGIPFDVGFHYTGCLGEQEILNRIWHYCNVLPYLTVLAFPHHGSDRLYLKKHKKPVDAFFSYDAFKDELKSHFPKENKGIDTYFDTIQDVCNNIPFYNPKLSLTDFLRGYKTPKTVLKKFLTSITSNSSLQSVFASPAMLYGIPSDNVSIEVHASVAHSYYQGAYSISGGGQSIVDAYKTACEHLGVSFFTSENVESILADTTGVTAINTTSGKRVSCHNVIFTGHPSGLINMTPKNCFRPAYRKRLLGLKNTISMNILFGTLPHPPESLNWNNHIFLPDGPDLAPQNLNKTGDRLLMLTSTERKSYSLQQPNKSVILLQPARWEEVQEFENSTSSSRSSRYEAHKKKISEDMIQQATKKWGGMFDNITTVAIGTPLTIRDELSAPEGCAYGAMHSLDQFTPDIRTRLPGLLLSGQSTLMTGLVGASISGMISAGEILGLEALWEEIR